MKKVIVKTSKLVLSGSPHRLDFENKEVQLFRKICLHKYGINVTKCKSHGASDVFLIYFNHKAR